jgi:hypothetical protein
MRSGRVVLRDLGLHLEGQMRSLIMTASSMSWVTNTTVLRTARWI